MKKYDLNDINVLFGLRVRQLRLERGLTQEQLGYECGLHRTYVGQIERAEKNITLKKYREDCETFRYKYFGITRFFENRN